MQSRFLLDVIIRKSSSILELFTSEDQPLLIRWDAFLILDLSLHILDGVRSFYLKGDRLPSQCLHEDLHSSPESQNQMQSRFFLNVIVRQCSSILQLLPSEDQPLLIRWDAFLVLDFRFHVLDSIRSFNLESDRLPGQSLDEDLHSTPQSENKMKRRFLLNVVRGFYFKSDGFSGQRLNEDLHSSSQTKD